MESIYRHRPLENPRSIRLLDLSPSKDNAFELPLSCSLIEVSLDCDASYEALSYTWEAQTPEIPIEIDGQHLLITKNCEAALLRLRRRSSRMLWIDAICIDQSLDAEEERSTQVPLMGDVYSKARAVIIWIGESTPESDLAIQYLKDFVRIAQKKHFRDWSFNRKLKKLRRADTRSEAAGTTMLGILESVVERSWFKRMWTVQEVALGRFKFVMCGSVIISWDELYIGLEIISMRQNIGKPWGKFEGSFGASVSCPVFFETLLRQRRTLERRGEPVPEPPTLSVVLFEAQRQQTTNPKDVIYGIYSLLIAFGLHLPTPDYTKSVAQIYTEAARAAILQNRTLDILYQVVSSRKFADLPSWVPSFNEKHIYYPYWRPEKFACSKDSIAKFKFQGESKLSVLGKYIGIISTCSPSVIGWTEAEEFDFTENLDIQAGFMAMYGPYVRAYREWCEAADMLDSYPTGEQVLKALRQTLVHDEPNRKDANDNQWDSKSFESGFNNWYGAVSSGMFEESNSLEFLAAVVESKYLPNKGSLDRFFNSQEKQSPDAIKKTLVYQIQTMIHANKDTREFDYVVLTRLRTSRFVLTSDSYMGTAPPMTKVGDEIFLVAGLTLPMVVRRDGEVYKVIGPAYIHGIMDGEKWPNDATELDWITLS